MYRTDRGCRGLISDFTTVHLHVAHAVDTWWNVVRTSKWLLLLMRMQGFRKL